MMLEKADGHTWPRNATCPIWMAKKRVYPTLAEVNSFFEVFRERYLESAMSFSSQDSGLLTSPVTYLFSATFTRRILRVFVGLGCA
jgi:hypothetical protein